MKSNLFNPGDRVSHELGGKGPRQILLTTVDAVVLYPGQGRKVPGYVLATCGDAPIREGTVSPPFKNPGRYDLHQRVYHVLEGDGPAQVLGTTVKAVVLYPDQPEKTLGYLIATCGNEVVDESELFGSAEEALAWLRQQG